MRSLRSNLLVRYAVIIVLLVLPGWVIRQLLMLVFGSNLLFTILVVMVLMVGAPRRSGDS